MVSCVGGPGQSAYMQSRVGDMVDKVTRHVLGNRDEKSHLDFTHSSSDERRYNALASI